VGGDGAIIESTLRYSKSKDFGAMAEGYSPYFLQSFINIIYLMLN
jgi:hypothetical protein